MLAPGGGGEVHGLKVTGRGRPLTCAASLVCPTCRSRSDSFKVFCVEEVVP